MGTKAAVVVGVDQVGQGYEKLESAAAGATQVAAWLRAESYDVELLTDAHGPVHANEVKEALKKFVTNPPTYNLLVVYFSGHGVWHARADRWLFSDAPQDTDDAINLGGAMMLASYSGIETVMFVSDACRSRSDREVSGIDAFPNLSFDLQNKVDYVKATTRGRDAFEAVLPAEVGGSGQRESVLTAAWRSAYLNPPDELVREVDVNGVPVKVVPNRKLEGYLQPRVDELLAAVDMSLAQNLAISVPSADDVFVARAQVDTSRPARRQPTVSRTPPLSPRSLAAGDRTTLRGSDDFGEVDVGLGRRLPRHEVRATYESGCGFVVTGADVSDVVCTPGDGGAEVEIVSRPSWWQPAGSRESSSEVRLWNVTPAVAVAFEFADGKSALLPAFEGFIGHVAVDEVGIFEVSYVPTLGTDRDDRFYEYQDYREETDDRRALVALAIDSNRFTIGDDDEAWQLASQIRIGKGVDPSLGLYAAVAYFEAGRTDQIESILSIMADDLNASFFDVRLLVSRRAGADPTVAVPHCPVLTQNWNQLRPRGVEIPAVLAGLEPFLLDSLWTTFSAEVSGVIVEAVRSGELG